MCVKENTHIYNHLYHLSCYSDKFCIVFSNDFRSFCIFHRNKKVLLKSVAAVNLDTLINFIIDELRYINYLLYYIYVELN